MIPTTLQRSRSPGRPRPPNPRLQRTRSASPPSPLSRQPLGGEEREGLAVHRRPGHLPRRAQEAPPRLERRSHGGVRPHPWPDGHKRQRSEHRLAPLSGNRWFSSSSPPRPLSKSLPGVVLRAAHLGQSHPFAHALVGSNSHRAAETPIVSYSSTSSWPGGFQ